MSLNCSLSFGDWHLLLLCVALAAAAAVHQLLLSEVAENVFNKFSVRVRKRERTIKIIDASCAHQSEHRQMKTKTK